MSILDSIHRRAVLTAAGAALLAGLATGLGGCTTAAEPMAEPMAEGNSLNFTFVALSNAPAMGNVQPWLALSGDGSFTPGSVEGGGNFTYVDAASDVPKTILSTGTWRATEVLRWVPAAGGATYGRINPGVLDLRVTLTPDNGPPIQGAVLRINCNVGFGGIVNNDPDTGAPLAEGFWLTLPPGTALGPTAGVGPFSPMDPIIGITVIER